MSDNKTVEILKLKKVTIKGFEVEKVSITAIEIFESICQPGITGFMSIKDYQGLQEIGQIFMDDDVTIDLDVDGDADNTISMKFKVFSNEGSKQLLTNTYDSLQISFCSPWLIDGLVKIVSKPYEKKLISEIVEDLLKVECGAEIGFIEPTKYKLETFVTPLWTPYHSIKYLLSFATNKDMQGGYLCWTDFKTGKVNVTSLDYMLKGTLGEYKSFEMYSENIRYSGRVLSSSIESCFNVFTQVDTGLPSTVFTAFNYDKKKLVVGKNDVTTTKQTRLGKKMPLTNKYKGKSYKNQSFVSLFPPTADSIASDDKLIEDLVEGVEKNHYAMLATDAIKINIETLGEMERRAGWIAELNYPSQGSQSGDQTGQKQYKGNYLIRDIKHSISMYEDYNQYITLVSDGFQEFKGDLITW